MNAKSFFSSIWFKCITTLLAIAIIAGGLLAILNTVLYVSPQERTSRAIKKIYGEEKQYSVILDVDGDDKTKSEPIVYDNVGKITKIYKVTVDDSYDYLFQTVGYQGYKGGTITCWVKVPFNSDTPTKIDKVLLEGYEKQTLMSKLGSDFYGKFTLTDVTEEYKSGKLFSATIQPNTIPNIVTGATKSATAGCNSVNCVINYLWGNN